MRTSADRDESYPRIRRVTATRVYVCACVRACVRACACVCVCVCARARGRIKVFMRAGAGARFLPSDCSLFRALHARMCTRTRPHPWARAKKMCTRVCVYIALLDCVPGGWIRRSPEIGCCEKKKRKTRSPNFFLQVTTAFIIATKDLESHRIIVDGTLCDYRYTILSR